VLTSLRKLSKVIDSQKFMEEYLTTQEVANLLRVKEITVRRWILRGWLPAIRFGKVFRIKMVDLEKYGRFNKKKSK